MVYWAIIFFVLAAIMGGAGILGAALLPVEVTQVLFVVFTAMFLISVALAVLRGRLFSQKEERPGMRGRFSRSIFSDPHNGHKT